MLEITPLVGGVEDKIRPTLPIHVAMPDTDVACELRGPGRVLFTPNHEMGGPMSSGINTIVDTSYL